MNTLYSGLTRYLSPQQLEILQKTTIGIAGLGGLGSNACIMLARTGISHFFLADYDTVDASNLNRQHYFPNDIGTLKASALTQYLQMLNPDISVTTCTEKITEKNVDRIILQASMWIEAFDKAQDKALLVTHAAKSNCFVASASGIAGYGGIDLKKRRLGNKMTVVGDFVSDVSFLPPLAPKVIWAAAMLADSILEALLTPSA